MNKLLPQNVALVAGASGIVGRQLVNTLLHNPVAGYRSEPPVIFPSR